MKYKKLTKEQIIISLDRLTRFKYTKDKYLRVFKDILVSNMIEPKYRKDEIENMDFSLVSQIVSELFNNSLDSDIEEANTEFNKFLKKYENKVFKNDENTQKLLNNTIDYQKAIKLFSEDVPVNLKWLKAVYENNKFDSKSLKSLRKKYALKYPLEKVVLVEGITEEILLPAFSRLTGRDFYCEGIQIIAAGGKNQVVKMYYELSQELNLPVFVLLDKDAEENINHIKPRLRDCDKIHLVSSGEFEDMLPYALIVKTVNSHFANFLTISEKDINSGFGMVKILEELFKTKGLHEFKKAEFAKLVRENINEPSDLSDEIKLIIEEIFQNQP